jgi:hypothetical protein
MHYSFFFLFGQFLCCPMIASVGASISVLPDDRQCRRKHVCAAR